MTSISGELQLKNGDGRGRLRKVRGTCLDHVRHHNASTRTCMVLSDLNSFGPSRLLDLNSDRLRSAYGLGPTFCLRLAFYKTK
jgi:hypothetical protein